ncbi:MAG: autotransporter domain-containing protein [Planctomycetaceae bacterium]|jgi:hypothetical protein|nr:autotransporter domain-containing protein [Planctomycetaceae bacterium]
MKNITAHFVLSAAAVFGCALTAAAQTNYTFNAPTALNDINNINAAFPNANAGVFIYIDSDPPTSPVFDVYTGTWTPVTPPYSGTPNNMSFSGFDISGFTFTTGQITSGVLINDAGGTGAGDTTVTVNGDITLSGSSTAPLSAFAYFGSGNGTAFFAEINASDTNFYVKNSGTGGANGLLFFGNQVGTAGADLAGHNINVGNITVISENDVSGSTSTGFFAGRLRDGSNVTLGDIAVSSSGTATAVSAVTIGGIAADSSLSVGAVSVTLDTNAAGLGIAARGIYVQGSAADVLGTLTIGGDINVTAASGTAPYARGIEIEGKAENLMIEHSVKVVSAENASPSNNYTSAVYVESGNITVDTTKDAALEISASNASGTQESILFGGSGTDDTLNITGTNTFTNGGKAFVVRGADNVNIKTDTTLAAGSQFTGVDVLTLTANKTLQFAAESGVTNIEADKVILGTGAEILFTGDYSLAGTTYNNVITVGDIDNAALLDTALDITHGLQRQEATASGSDISVTLSQLTLGGFLGGREVNINTAATGNLLDSYAAGNAAVQSTLSAMDDDGSVLNLLQFLTSGGESVVNIGRTALWNPHFRVFNRLYGEADDSHLRRRNIRYSRQPAAVSDDQYRGQCGSRCGDIYPSGGSGLWMEGYYQDENVTGDAFASRYDTTRWGIMVGKEERIAPNALAGMVFGYGNPKVRNGYAAAQADDYTFAGYANVHCGGNVHGNFFLGYGHQEYESAVLLGGRESQTSFGGNALYTSFELYQVLHLVNGLVIYPLAAFDYQQSWTDSTTLNGGTIWAMRLHKQSLAQGIIRTGLNAKLRTTEGVDFRSRIQYGYLAAGDPYASAGASFTGNPDFHQTFRGVNMSRSNLNLGLGMDCTTGTSYKLFVNYDFDYGDKSKRHTSEVGLATAW